MLPTYNDGGLNFANRAAYWWRDPARGDAVAIRMAGEHVVYVKRIVGLPRERIAIIAGVVLVNDEPLIEPTVVYRAPWDVPGVHARRRRVFRDRRQPGDGGAESRLRKDDARPHRRKDAVLRSRGAVVVLCPLAAIACAAYFWWPSEERAVKNRLRGLADTLSIPAHRTATSAASRASRNCAATLQTKWRSSPARPIRNRSRATRCWRRSRAGRRRRAASRSSSSTCR